jgi:hypothetical protein
MSGIDESGSGADASAGIFVQGPAVSALPLSLALKDAAAGDQGSLVELFRKLAEGEIDGGDVLQVSIVAFKKKLWSQSKFAYRQNRIFSLTMRFAPSLAGASQPSRHGRLHRCIHDPGSCRSLQVVFLCNHSLRNSRFVLL